MIGCCQHSRGLRYLPSYSHECLTALSILMRRPCCEALVSCATIRSVSAAAAAARTLLSAAGAAAGSILVAGFRACQPAPAAGETLSPLWKTPFAQRRQPCRHRPVPAELCQLCPQLCAGCSWTCKSSGVSILQMPAPLILLQPPVIGIAELCITLTSFLMHAGAHHASAA